MSSTPRRGILKNSTSRVSSATNLSTCTNNKKQVVVSDCAPATYGTSFEADMDYGSLPDTKEATSKPDTISTKTWYHVDLSKEESKNLTDFELEDAKAKKIRRELSGMRVLLEQACKSSTRAKDTLTQHSRTLGAIQKAIESKDDSDLSWRTDEELRDQLDSLFLCLGDSMQSYEEPETYDAVQEVIAKRFLLGFGRIRNKSVLCCYTMGSKS